MPRDARQPERFYEAPDVELGAPADVAALALAAAVEAEPLGRARCRVDADRADVPVRDRQQDVGRVLPGRAAAADRSGVGALGIGQVTAGPGAAPLTSVTVIVGGSYRKS